MSRYIPPSKRVAKKDEPIISLSEDHFPEFTPTQVSKTSMNFSECFKVVPKEPTVITGLDAEAREKLIKDGWVFLKLDAVKEPGYCERWNEKHVKTFFEGHDFNHKYIEKERLIESDSE